MTSSVWDVVVIQQDQPKPRKVMEWYPFPGPVFAHDKGEDKRNLFTVVDADYAAESLRYSAAYPRSGKKIWSSLSQ